MATLIDKAGNRYPFSTLTEHEDSLTLDGDRIIQGKLADFTIDTGVPPTVGPIFFKMLWTSDERIRAKKLRALATDVGIKVDDFWSLLDDAVRTNSEVVMALPSVHDGIRDTLAAINADGGSHIDVEARFDQILAGVLQ